MQISEDIYYLGANDYNIDLFESHLRFQME